jgi:hypothetical protein
MAVMQRENITTNLYVLWTMCKTQDVQGDENLGRRLLGCDTVKWRGRIPTFINCVSYSTKFEMDRYEINKM